MVNEAGRTVGRGRIEADEGWNCYLGNSCSIFYLGQAGISECCERSRERECCGEDHGGAKGGGRTGDEFGTLLAERKRDKIGIVGSSLEDERGHQAQDGDREEAAKA